MSYALICSATKGREVQAPGLPAATRPPSCHAVDAHAVASPRARPSLLSHA